MAVNHVKVEYRCKLCKHPMVEEINALLEKRSKREKDADGKAVNIGYVIEKLTAWGVTNPTEENVKLHAQKHLEFVDEAVIVATKEAASAAARELVREAGNANVDVDENLKWIIAIGRAEIEARIQAGQKSGITTDHVLKATTELTRRDHSETQRDLLGALVGGIGHALAEAIPAKQIAEGEVIDIEPTEET